MIFFITFTVVLGLQLLHRKVLKELLPPRWIRGVTWALILIHLPLALYMGLRLSGNAAHDLGHWLRPWARLGLYFQVLTLLNLVLWALDALIWRLEGHKPEPDDPARRAFLRKGAAIGSGLITLAALKGRSDALSDPRITRLELIFPDLPPAFDGLRLVQLTDLHAGPLVKEAQLLRWRQQAERERPDLLLITGDFVDSLPEELTPFLRSFRDFPAALGRFAVLGNHDYFTDPVPLWDGLEGIGIGCLENRHALLERDGQQIAVLGLQDLMARNGRFQGIRFGPGPDAAAATRGLSPATWRMALIHRPGDWEEARRAGARLSLAGHTHGGQINPIPGLSSARLLGARTQGLFRSDQDVLYVSRGLGTVGIPLRIAAPPELVVITLRRERPLAISRETR